MTTRPRLAASLLLVLVIASSCVGSGEETTAASDGALRVARPAKGAVTGGLNDSWPVHALKAEQSWQLNLPNGQRFDASGLAITARGELLTINDRGASVYRISFSTAGPSADLVELTNCFTRAQLHAAIPNTIDRYDGEGIAIDGQDRIYICEESNRWVLRCDAAQGKVERLPIDWTPVKKYFAGDLNASFEGVAVGGGRLYVANEREMGRIIEVELETLRVTDDFSVRPRGSNARDIHYSDLSFFDGVLYALLRESYCVLAVNPASHQVLAEYNFRDMEREPELLYRSLLPTSQMEGLAVDAGFIWLVTDNNGTARARHPTDTRPTLFKCRRPPATPLRK